MSEIWYELHGYPSLAVDMNKYDDHAMIAAGCVANNDFEKRFFWLNQSKHSDFIAE